MRRIVILLAGLVALVGAGVFTATGATGAPGDPAAAAGPSPGTFVVNGNVKRRLVLSTRVLEKLPQRTLQVTYRSGSGTETRTFTGPLLLDVLDLAEPYFDPAVRNDKLRHFISVTASDAYEAVVAWGEIDPEFANTEVLLATTQDGVSLAEEGPRLVVPSDGRGGRYVSGVVRVTLKRG